jgi:hypothetical protein
MTASSADAGLHEPHLIARNGSELVQDREAGFSGRHELVPRADVHCGHTRDLVGREHTGLAVIIT